MGAKKIAALNCSIASMKNYRRCAGRSGNGLKRISEIHERVFNLSPKKIEVGF
jgi:hypothetical protein